MKFNTKESDYHFCETETGHILEMKNSPIGWNTWISKKGSADIDVDFNKSNSQEAKKNLIKAYQEL